MFQYIFAPVQPAQTFVVHHEDLLKAPGSRDFMTSTFTDKVFFRNFLAQLDRMGLDYFDEFTPDSQPEDGLAYELEDDESQSWDELLEEIEAPGFI